MTEQEWTGSDVRSSWNVGGSQVGSHVISSRFFGICHERSKQLY